MSVVAGVLADHVQVDEPQGTFLTVQRERIVQRRSSDGGVGPPELVEQPGVIGRGTRGIEVVEVGIRSEGRVVQGVQVLARESFSKPASLHLRYVAQQAKQRQGRRRNRSAGQLRSGETGTPTQQN